jgi:glutaminase
MGRVPSYIPALAEASPDWMAVQVRLVTGTSFVVSYVNRRLPLMSVSKPFVLLFLLEQQGADSVFARVGMAASDQPFHSIAQLTVDQGFPRNPMINSGAITLAAQLPGATGSERCEALRQWLNQAAGCDLVLDQDVLESVRSLDNEANRMLARVLAQAGYIDDIDLALDTYNQICCLAGTVGDLSRLGVLLAQPIDLDRSLGQLHRSSQKVVNALMLTCGLYEASGSYAVRVGLPMKSGVSGGLLAVVPGEGAIACYSPPLDSYGNSIAGLFLVETLATELQLSLFNP